MKNVVVRVASWVTASKKSCVIVICAIGLGCHGVAWADEPDEFDEELRSGALVSVPRWSTDSLACARSFMDLSGLMDYRPLKGDANSKILFCLTKPASGSGTAIGLHVGAGSAPSDNNSGRTFLEGELIVKERTGAVKSVEYQQILDQAPDISGVNIHPQYNPVVWNSPLVAGQSAIADVKYKNAGECVVTVIFAIPPKWGDCIESTAFQDRGKGGAEKDNAYIRICAFRDQIKNETDFAKVFNSLEASKDEYELYAKFFLLATSDSTHTNQIMEWIEKTKDERVAKMMICMVDMFDKLNRDLFNGSVVVKSPRLLEYMRERKKIGQVGQNIKSERYLGEIYKKASCD